MKKERVIHKRYKYMYTNLMETKFIDQRIKQKNVKGFGTYIYIFNSSNLKYEKQNRLI